MLSEIGSTYNYGVRNFPLIAERNPMRLFPGNTKKPRGNMADLIGDFYGVPEFFINCVTTECAGNGNIRIFNYAKRGGILVPQFTAVLAAASFEWYPSQRPGPA